MGQGMSGPRRGRRARGRRRRRGYLFLASYARERADANFVEMAKMVKISRAEGALEPKPILKVSDPCRFQNVSHFETAQNRLARGRLSI